MPSLKYWDGSAWVEITAAGDWADFIASAPLAFDPATKRLTFDTATTSLTGYVKKTGDTMTGTLNMRPDTGDALVYMYSTANYAYHDLNTLDGTNQLHVGMDQIGRFFVGGRKPTNKTFLRLSADDAVFASRGYFRYGSGDCFVNVRGSGNTAYLTFDTKYNEAAPGTMNVDYKSGNFGLDANGNFFFAHRIPNTVIALTVEPTKVDSKVPVLLPGDPTADLHAATKKYVDDKTSLDSRYLMLNKGAFQRVTGATELSSGNATAGGRVFVNSSGQVVVESLTESVFMSSRDGAASISSSNNMVSMYTNAGGLKRIAISGAGFELQGVPSGAGGQFLCIDPNTGLVHRSTGVTRADLADEIVEDLDAARYVANEVRSRRADSETRIAELEASLAALEELVQKQAEALEALVNAPE